MTDAPIGNAGKPRLFAMMIDSFLASILGLVVAANVPDLGDVARGVVLCGAYLSYYLFPEALWSRTLGKLICGLVVQKSDGRPCGWPAALARTLLRIVEVNPLLFGAFPGGLTVIFSKRRQRVGDMLGDTVVVRSRQREDDTSAFRLLSGRPDEQLDTDRARSPGSVRSRSFESCGRKPRTSTPGSGSLMSWKRGSRAPSSVRY